MTTKTPSKKPASPAPAVKEDFAVWAIHEVGKTWDNLMEATDIAQDAANRHKCKEMIYKLVKVVEPER